MHYITDDFYSVEKINALVVSVEKIGISEASKIKVSACADYLKRKLTTGNEVIYGINTGFGSMCNTVINNKELEELQVNLVRSHACGAGAKIPIVISKRILLLKYVKKYVLKDTSEPILLLLQPKVLI